MTTVWLLPSGALARLFSTSNGSGSTRDFPSTTPIDITGALCRNFISLARTAATSFSVRFSSGTVNEYINTCPPFVPTHNDEDVFRAESLNVKICTKHTVSGKVKV